MYGKEEFEKVAEKLRGIFVEPPTVQKNGRFSLLIERFLTSPQEVLDAAAAGADRFHTYLSGLSDD